MSILRLLPLAASVDALRLEVAAYQPELAPACTVTIDKDSPGRFPVMTAEKEIVEWYEQAQMDHTKTVLLQALQIHEIRENCIEDLAITIPLARELNGLSPDKRYELIMKSPHTGKIQERVQMYRSASDEDLAEEIRSMAYGEFFHHLRMADKADKHFEARGLDVNAKTVFANGVHRMSQLARGRGSMENPVHFEQLLRAWVEKDGKYQALTDGCGPMMKHLNDIYFPQALVLYTWNVFDFKMYKGPAKSEISSNVNSILCKPAMLEQYFPIGGMSTPPPTPLFWTETLYLAGCKIIEFTEKNACAKANKWTINETFMYPADDLRYAIDDYANDHPAKDLISKIQILKFNAFTTQCFVKFAIANKATILEELAASTITKETFFSKMTVGAGPGANVLWLNLVFNNQNIRELVFEFGLTNTEFGPPADNREGLNSAQAANALVRLIKKVHPDLLVLMQGGNANEHSKTATGPVAEMMYGHELLGRSCYNFSPDADEALEQA